MLHSSQPGSCKNVCSFSGWILSSGVEVMAAEEEGAVNPPRGWAVVPGLQERGGA